MNDFLDTYRRRADLFEQKVAAVTPDDWSNPSPCAEWDARAVVGHVLDMHGVVMRPLDRTLSPAPALSDDPLGAFRAARADVEGILTDPELAERVVDTPGGGQMTLAEHVNGVPSGDMVVHGWDLARAAGLDDTIDPLEVEHMWPGAQNIPEVMRTPNAFGPGIIVFGPEFLVPADSPIQDRLLGAMGRNPQWTP
ncbi:maleylpyruvate isomerase family mycothiol-dependent enzyme [soil metagenome]